MMDTCFTTHDESFQEVVTFSTTVNQKSFADVQKLFLVQFCELLCDSSCTYFMEGKAVVDNFIG
jgi:hypothetical protein